MLIIFVPSDEDEVSEDPRPVPRKSKKKYGKVIQHFLILHFDLWSMKSSCSRTIDIRSGGRISPAKTGHSQGYHVTDSF